MHLLIVSNQPRRWYQIIFWWETRRILYNIIMLLAGFTSFFISYVSIPLIYLIIGLGLNLVYTLGWISEIAINLYFKSEAMKMPYAPKAFKVILIISVLFVFGFSLGFFL